VIADEKPISMFRLFRNLLLATGFVLLTSFTPLDHTANTKILSAPLSFSSLSISGNINVFATNLSSKYDEWKLANMNISKDLFNYAVKGYQYLAKKNILRNTDILTIADMSKPSSEKRLFVLNVNTGEVLFKTLVAHGRNSGHEYAKKFSNGKSSYASSLGFYVTTDTYFGKHGYSLRLQGCEKGFNDNANRRAIVVHGASYVSESFIEQNGYLGRSQGCPAVPEELSKKIIDVIKNGSCLFVYSPLKKYLKQSNILNK
jgi:hypothetical protein